MKLLHTSDWHLGRGLHGASLLDEQRWVLEERLLPLVADERPAVLVIAGDVYDRAVPHPDAVRLLDEVLARLTLELGVPVAVIAGNHDSGDRLGFGARMLAAGRLHVVGRVGPEPDVVRLEDAHGPVHLHLVPFLEPGPVREMLGDESVRDQESAMAAVLARARGAQPEGERSVVVAHAFVPGGTTSESERPLVGGASEVPAAVFDGFDYVALGHLHRPQQVGPRVRYAGSLMKYSFSEVEHLKSVSVVELGPSGEVEVREAPLEPRRDLRRIEGTLEELIEAGRTDPARDDWVEAMLRDDGPVFDAMRRLREGYPNALHLSFPERERELEAGSAPRDPRQQPHDALFALYYRHVAGEELTEAQLALYREVTSKVSEDGA